MWRNILKEETFLEKLNEEIEEGYEIKFNESISAIVVVATKYNNLVFRLTSLHRDFPIPHYQSINNYEDWYKLSPEVVTDKTKASVRGLNLFLTTVAQNGHLGSIKQPSWATKGTTWGMSDSYMTLADGTSGVEFIFALTARGGCDTTLTYDDNVASLCLSYDEVIDKPVSPDSWLSIYMIYNTIKNYDSEQIYALEDKAMIPNVITTAFKAVTEEDFVGECGVCSNIVDINNQFQECDNCGYILEDYPDTSEIKAEEDSDAKIVVEAVAWECPYGEERVNLHESCLHGVYASDDGPRYGYVVDGSLMSNLDLFYTDEGYIIGNPDNNNFSIYEAEEITNIFEMEFYLPDFIEVFGDGESALDALGIPYENNGGTPVFMQGGVKYKIEDEEYFVVEDDVEEFKQLLENYNIDSPQYGDFNQIDSSVLDEAIEEEIQTLNERIAELKEAGNTARTYEEEKELEEITTLVTELGDLLERI